MLVAVSVHPPVLLLPCAIEQRLVLLFSVAERTDHSVRVVKRDGCIGWSGFNGILSTQVAAISSQEIAGLVSVTGSQNGDELVTAVVNEIWKRHFSCICKDYRHNCYVSPL